MVPVVWGNRHVDGRHTHTIVYYLSVIEGALIVVVDNKSDPEKEALRAGTTTTSRVSPCLLLWKVDLVE
jgi:hypothetical protein